MNKYQEAYKEASNLTPKDFLLAKVRKANKLVKQACEKAEKYDELKTPKKPIYKDDGTGDHYYFCANCDAKVPLCSNLIDQIKYKHCPYCGREIDWSDEE